MKTLSPEKSRKLRGLIAKALDKASAKNEKRTCELAVCKMLAELGLGVDGDPGLELVLLTDDEIRSRTIPAVTVINIAGADGDVRKERYSEAIFNDLFGGSGFGGGRRRR